MANIKVLGNAAVITSTLKYEDIKKVQKYRPDALVLRENDEPVFKVGISEHQLGDCSKYGISFGGSNEAGYATVTTTFGECEDVKAWLADKYGAALAYLNSMEASLPAVIGAVDAERAAILDSITVM